MKEKRVLKARRGYVYTISAFLLMGTVLLFAVLFSGNSKPADTSALKISMIYDDIRTDLISLFGVSASVENEYNTTTVSLNDSAPSPAWSYLANYEYYLEFNYSKHVGGPLEQRQGSLAGADIMLNSTNQSLLILPHKYVYSYNNLSKNEIYVYPLANASALLGFVVNLTSRSLVLNMTQSITPGNLTAVVAATYDNRTVYSSASVSRLALSEWRIETAEGNITVDAGNFFIGSLNATSAISLEFDGDSSAGVLTSLSFNQTLPVEIESGMSVEIRDISRASKLVDKIWFLRE